MSSDFGMWWAEMEATSPWMKARGLDQAIRQIAEAAWDSGFAEGFADCYDSYSLDTD